MRAGEARRDSEGVGGAREHLKGGNIFLRVTGKGKNNAVLLPLTCLFFFPLLLLVFVFV